MLSKILRRSCSFKSNNGPVYVAAAAASDGGRGGDVFPSVMMSSLSVAVRSVEASGNECSWLSWGSGSVSWVHVVGGRVDVCVGWFFSPSVVGS